MVAAVKAAVAICTVATPPGHGRRPRPPLIAAVPRAYEGLSAQDWRRPAFEMPGIGANFFNNVC